MPFELPPLPYAHDALEPYLDARTMRLHHEKHHAGYVKKLNTAVSGTEWSTSSLEEMLRRLDEIPEAIRQAVRNNGGGHFNHSLFWTCMALPAEGGGEEPTGELAEEIERAFGSFSDFQQGFGEIGMKVFGAGWVWLCLTPDQDLAVVTTANQDTCFMPRELGGYGRGSIPLLGLDLWEHAYYLKHKNHRAGYINDWWNVVNWAQVSTNLQRVRGSQSLLTV